MSKKNKSVLGIYSTRPMVEKAIDSLKEEGFSSADISVLLPEESGSQELAHVKSSKAPEGSAAGVSTGAVIGGTLGLLAGVGALSIPGVGAFIAAGPIISVLAGVGVGGAAGGVTGALIGMGIPEYEAKRYDGYIQRGGILLSVHAESSEELSRAEKCLERTGAADVSSTRESKSDWPSTHAPRNESVVGATYLNQNKI